jgi:hypothetical protein
MGHEVVVLNYDIQRKVILVSNAGILLYLSSRTHAATMLYAISVPIDIMSTSSFRSKIRVIRAANENKPDLCTTLPIKSTVLCFRTFKMKPFDS